MGGQISWRYEGAPKDGGELGRSPRNWNSRGDCAVTTMKGADQPLNAGKAGLAAVPAAGQKTVITMSNQMLALSQVFPL